MNARLSFSPAQLKFHRAQTGMSQATLAAKLRELTGTATVSANYVYRWEAGLRTPDDWLVALALVLKVEVSDLCDPSDTPQAASRSAPPSVPEDWAAVSDLLRRTFLKHGIAAAGLPAIGMGELQHIAAALDNAHRYADSALVDHFSRSLQAIASTDRTTGPSGCVPEILGLIAAVERTTTHAKPAVRLDLMNILGRACELAGWFYRDLAATGQAGYWHDRAMEWAQAAGNIPMQGYVLLKKAQAAWDDRDGLKMLTLAQAAHDGPWTLPAKIRAEAAQQVARGHAMLGSELSTVQRHLDRARGLLATEERPADGLSPHYDEALFEIQVAYTLALTGQTERALEAYDQWLKPEVFGHRDYGFHLAFKAEAVAATGDTDTAAIVALRSLAIARATRSARTHAALIRLTGELRPHWNRPRVRELRDAIVA